jgi:hypothetical protein
MSTQETFALIRSTGLQALCVTDDDIDEMRRYFAHRDSIGPILDPTSYRNEMKAAEKARTLFDAFAAFHVAVRKLLADDLAQIGAAKLNAEEARNA